MSRPQIRRLVRRTGVDERGVSTVEAALVIVAFFLIVFGAVQADIFYHARNAAQSAAAACAEHARGAGAGAGDGRHSADAIISQSGALDGYSVAVSTNAATVTCSVTGHAPVVIDLGLGQISQTASMPKERVTRTPR